MVKGESVEAASSVFATENGGIRLLGIPKNFLLPVVCGRPSAVQGEEE